MDTAASHAHYEIVKWLYANRDSDDECSTVAMDYVTKNEDLGMLIWLRENQVGICTTNAMDYAAAREHLEMIKWLHE